MEVGETEPLWRVCREKKEKLRLRNEDIAAQEQISVNAVAQFLRGETKSVSLYIGAAICRALHVSLDQHFEIVPDDLPVSKSDTELPHETELQKMRLDHAQKETLIYKRVAYAFGVIVALVLVALIIDLTNTNIGWFRG